MAETFETLKALMGDWLGVDSVRFPDAARGACLNFIQRRVIRNHDLRFAEITDTLAVTAGIYTYVLPAGWRSPLHIWYINPSTEARIDLVRQAKDDFDARHSDPSILGTSTTYTIWGQTFYIGATPEASFTLNRNYYAFLPNLVDGAPNNTNPFVEEAPDVLFFGALGHASKYLLEDPRAPMWEAQFAELEADLAGEHQREKSSGRIPQSREPG